MGITGGFEQFRVVKRENAPKEIQMRMKGRETESNKYNSLEHHFKGKARKEGGCWRGIKKCEWRACLYASWKGPEELTGRTRQKNE